MVSDFILPEDIGKMAQQSAQDIADGWAMLERICMIKQYPLDIAYNKVYASLANGLMELEALHKVYHDVAKA